MMGTEYLPQQQSIFAQNLTSNYSFNIDTSTDSNNRNFYTNNHNHNNNISNANQSYQQDNFIAQNLHKVTLIILFCFL